MLAHGPSHCFLPSPTNPPRISPPLQDVPPPSHSTDTSPLKAFLSNICFLLCYPLYAAKSTTKKTAARPADDQDTVTGSTVQHGCDLYDSEPTRLRPPRPRLEPDPNHASTTQLNSGGDGQASTAAPRPSLRPRLRARDHARTTRQDPGHGDGASATSTTMMTTTTTGAT